VVILVHRSQEELRRWLPQHFHLHVNQSCHWGGTWLVQLLSTCSHAWDPWAHQLAPQTCNTVCCADNARMPDAFACSQAHNAAMTAGCMCICHEFALAWQLSKVSAPRILCFMAPNHTKNTSTHAVTLPIAAPCLSSDPACVLLVLTLA
jgi:hypothetical protein